jgi:SAM-dependent methyltransferase
MYEVSLLQHNWLAMKMGNAGFRRRMAGLKGTVYDLGCGERPFEKEILACAERYVGVDWSNTPHELRADIVADLNGPLPIPDATADAVLALSVLEHLREPRQMLGEAFRILKPGGFLYVAVPFQWWVHEAPHDYFRFTRYGLQYLLETTGFERIEIEETSGFWVTWFLKLNYQTNRLVGGPAPLRWLIRACLLPLWLSDQLIAPVLDRFWHAPCEAQGYNAAARKP